MKWQNKIQYQQTIETPGLFIAHEINKVTLKTNQVPTYVPNPVNNILLNNDNSSPLLSRRLISLKKIDHKIIPTIMLIIKYSNEKLLM